MIGDHQRIARKRVVATAALVIATAATPLSLATRAQAQNSFNLFDFIRGATSAPRSQPQPSAAASAGWRRIAAAELACIDKQLKKLGTSARTLRQSGVAVSDTRVATARSVCRKEREAAAHAAEPPPLPREDGRRAATAAVVAPEGEAPATTAATARSAGAYPDAGTSTANVPPESDTGGTTAQAPDATAQGDAAVPSDTAHAYALEDLTLGGRVSPDSLRVEAFQCSASEQFPGLTWCQRAERVRGRGDRTTLVSILYTGDKRVAYVNRVTETAGNDADDLQGEIDKLSEQFGEKPHIMRGPDKSGVPDSIIAIWGSMKLEPLDPDSIAILARGESPHKGLLIDYLGNFQRSAKLDLPVYRLAGGRGYVWSGSADRRRRGHERVLIFDGDLTAPHEPAPSPAPVAAAPAAPGATAQESAAAPTPSPDVPVAKVITDRAPTAPVTPPASNAAPPAAPAVASAPAGAGAQPDQSAAAAAAADKTAAEKFAADTLAAQRAAAERAAQRAAQDNAVAEKTAAETTAAEEAADAKLAAARAAAEKALADKAALEKAAAERIAAAKAAADQASAEKAALEKAAAEKVAEAKAAAAKAAAERAAAEKAALEKIAAAEKAAEARAAADRAAAEKAAAERIAAERTAAESKAAERIAAAKEAAEKKIEAERAAAEKAVRTQVEAMRLALAKQATSGETAAERAAAAGPGTPDKAREKVAKFRDLFIGMHSDQFAAAIKQLKLDVKMQLSSYGTGDDQEHHLLLEMMRKKSSKPVMYVDVRIEGTVGEKFASTYGLKVLDKSDDYTIYSGVNPPKLPSFSVRRMVFYPSFFDAEHMSADAFAKVLGDKYRLVGDRLHDGSNKDPCEQCKVGLLRSGESVMLRKGEEDDQWSLEVEQASEEFSQLYREPRL